MHDFEAERGMMLSLNGCYSSLDAFEYYLAEKLGRTVGELRETMDQAEFVEWQAYQVAQNAVGHMHAKEV